MTLTDAAEETKSSEIAGNDGGNGQRSKLSAVAGAPLWIHALLLACVLATGLIAVRPLAATFTDEGAGILQARHLERTGSWLIPRPDASIDPEGTASIPLRGDNGTKGKAFYARHPLLPVMFQALDGIGGRLAFTLFALFGTWISALFAALCARRLSPGIDVLTLWIVGVASPLFFDGYLAVTYTVGAACSVVALWSALRTREGGSVVVGALVIAASCGLGVALRTEAIFVPVALTVGLAVASLRRGSSRRIHSAVLAVCALVSAVAGRLIEQRVFESIIGTPMASGPSLGDFTWLEGRINSFTVTLFHVTEGGRASDVLPLVGCLALLVASRFVKKPAAIAGAWVVVAAAYLGLVVMGHDANIKGLFMAFPLAWFALLRWSLPKHGSSGAALLTAVSVGVYSLLVILTQYGIGGGYEWGGRFFAGLIPWAGPLIAWSVHHELRQLSPQLRRVTAAAMAVTVICIAVTALVTIRTAHAVSHRAESRMAQQLAAVEPETVVVWTQPLIAQNFWDDADSKTWLIPPTEELAETYRRIHARGDRQIVVVTANPETDAQSLGPHYRLSDRRPLTNNWTLITGRRVD